MRTYGAVAMTGVRAVALVGILPGAIVAGAYLLVLSGELYRHWDLRIAIVLGMAAWGVLGVFELWHEYVRSARNHGSVERKTVSPRALLFLWALILVAVAGWKIDERPWIAAFLALVALYSFARAFGLLAKRSAASGRAPVREVHGADRRTPQSRRRHRVSKSPRTQGTQR